MTSSSDNVISNVAKIGSDHRNHPAAPPPSLPLNMGFGHVDHHEQASNEELNGLRVLATVTAKAAAEYRLMKKLAEERLGTHHVEQQVWELTTNREEKKGVARLQKMKKGYYERQEQRDLDCVRKEMNLRAGLVNSDGQELEGNLRALKEERLRNARNEAETNRLERELKRLSRESDRVF